MEKNTSTPMFVPLKDAVRMTGLSDYCLRSGCQAGTIPHIKSGARYFVNVDALNAQYSGTTKDSVPKVTDK